MYETIPLDKICTVIQSILKSLKILLAKYQVNFLVVKDKSSTEDI